MWTQNQKVRKNPQLSLGLLGEYMVASFVRKRSILRESKYPKSFIVPQFDPAQKAAARYLAYGGGDQEQLLQDIEGMLTGSTRSRWFQQRDKLCQQALKCIMGLESDLKLEDLDVAVGNNPRHRMTLSGVAVTVVPDLIIRGIGPRGPFVGAVKFRYVKTKPINAEWAAYSATLLHQFVSEHLAGEQLKVECRHCRYVDVFAGKIYEAPSSFKERRKDVEAACWQIKGLWNSVQPKN